MQAPNGDTKDFEEVVQTVSHDQSYAEEGLEMQKFNICLVAYIARHLYPFMSFWVRIFFNPHGNLGNMASKYTLKMK
jgi:hypothetical protein